MNLKLQSKTNIWCYAKRKIIYCDNLAFVILYIIGIDDKKVFVPKGTYIQIPNWSRHRNPLLWGKDVNIFNPDREFHDDEIWNGEVLSSYNPSSKRFSPFTYGPRDCIGKNFSQMEMRIILLHLLRKYSFQLSHKQLYSYKEEDIGINKFTLGPRDYYDRDKIGLYVNIYDRYINILFGNGRFR